jgi:hypothetical protein
MTMALTNAEKQARWRERNVVKLTDRAQDIAAQLIGMDDQAKLKKIARFINDHLKHPERDQTERLIALGSIGTGGLNGPLGKTAALAAYRQRSKPKPDHSYRVEVVTADGQRWCNGVRLGTVEEAQIYASHHARDDFPSYVTADTIRCDGERPLNSIIRPSRGAKPQLSFQDGTCQSLDWRPLWQEATA